MLPDGSSQPYTEMVAERCGRRSMCLVLGSRSRPSRSGRDILLDDEDGPAEPPQVVLGIEVVEHKHDDGHRCALYAVAWIATLCLQHPAWTFTR